MTNARAWIPWAALGAAVFAVSLAIQAPAVLIEPVLRRNVPVVSVSGTDGTLWQGKTTVQWMGGGSGTRVEWRVRPLALFKGRAVVALKLAGDLGGSAMVALDGLKRQVEIDGDVAPSGAAPGLEPFLDFAGPDLGGGRRKITFVGPLPPLSLL
ncbi:MAG: type II secretion system protein N [Elusimicrobia bacterium]|nr:type II secretion system protein N [Elusimicrobiota bacterium]